MGDAATFNRLDLHYIWNTDFPPCIVCQKVNAQNWHHIFGRGGKYHRKLHSSVFNAAPVCEACHAKGDINSDAPELLGIVTKKIAESNYVPSENDHGFIQRYA